MGSSFTKHRGAGFWSRDSGLELWLCLLAEEARRIDDPSEWLRRAAEDWHIQATSGFNGFVSAGLDEHASTPERVALVLELAERALSRLRQQGSMLSVDWLNSFKTGGPNSRFTRDAPCEVFAPVGEAFIKLLRGKITWDAANSPTV